jgi:hypothetical protein
MGPERERRLVEGHVPRGDDAPGLEVVTTIVVMVGRVPDEDASRGTGA